MGKNKKLVFTSRKRSPKNRMGQLIGLYGNVSDKKIEPKIDDKDKKDDK